MSFPRDHRILTLDKGQNGNTKGYSNRYGRNGTVATVHESGKTTINGVTPLRGGPDIQALAAGVDRARGDYRGLEWCSPGCDYDTLDMIFNACSLKYVACIKGYIFRAQLDRMAAFCLEIGCGGEGGNKALLRNKDAYQKTRKDLRCSTGKNSFSADTEVLMADGRTKIISKIEAGDMVMATDPETGRAGPREVLETHINDDTELTDLKIRVGRKAEAVVRTTQDHPFWNAALQEWVNADSLHGRTRLSTLGRSPATVIAARSYIGRRLMYNLTVDDIHTYYVLAGTTPVLVHNCDEPWMAPASYTHVDKNHGPNAPAGKGKFDAEVDLDDLADEAAKFAPQKQVNGRCNRVCTLPDNRILGKDQSGLPTNVYTVVTETNGRVVTMHPGMPN